MPHSDKNMMDDDEQRIQAIVGGPIEDVDRDEARERFYRHMETHLELPCEVTGHSDFDWEEWYVFGRGDRDEYEELKKTQPSHSDRYELLSVNLDASEWMLFPHEDIAAHVRRKSDGSEFVLGLSELKVVAGSPSTAQLIEDFFAWMGYR